jgi:hypothetical protein
MNALAVAKVQKQTPDIFSGLTPWGALQYMRKQGQILVKLRRAHEKVVGQRDAAVGRDDLGQCVCRAKHGHGAYRTLNIPGGALAVGVLALLPGHFCTKPTKAPGCASTRQ